MLCGVTCAERLTAVGHFFCFHERLYGASTCESQASPTERVTRFVGNFQLVVQLRRLPGLGPAFRDSILAALAETLVVPTQDFAKLKVALNSSAFHLDGQIGSSIDIHFDLVIRRPYMVQQIQSDLDGLADPLNGAHQELVRRMTLAGYHVIYARQLSMVVSFPDIVLSESTPTSLTDNGLSERNIAIFVAASLCLMCCACSLVTAAWRRRRRSKLAPREQSSVPETAANSKRDGNRQVILQSDWSSV